MIPLQEELVRAEAERVGQTLVRQEQPEVLAALTQALVLLAAEEQIRELDSVGVVAQERLDQLVVEVGLDLGAYMSPAKT